MLNAVWDQEMWPLEGRLVCSTVDSIQSQTKTEVYNKLFNSIIIWNIISVNSNKDHTI